MPQVRRGPRRDGASTGGPAEEDDAGGDAGAVRVNRSLAIPLSELTFRFGPSGGPGGQHANKASTRVELRFDVEHSPSLARDSGLVSSSDSGRQVRVVADGNRSQARNRQEAVERLRERLADALTVDTAAHARPDRPAAAVERRLDDKRRRSEQKRARRPAAED